MATAWRLITTWGTQPGFNMALDEALLESAFAPPTLRLYTWGPTALSLGYFQRWNDVPGTATAKAVVRRLTGGGAIHHENELTFSIAVGLDHPLYRGPVADSYVRVHDAIAGALAGFGVAASHAGDVPQASDREGTGMCFHRSTAQDLCWGGRKGVGSAQRRKAGRVLHHGSIKLGTTPLEGEIATLDQGADPRSTDPAAVGRAVAQALAEVADARLEPSVPDRAERAQAAERAPWFSSEEFLRRR